MPYITHPVRRLRDHPDPDESVTLLVTAQEGTDRHTLAAALEDLGTIEARLRFDTVKVTVPQPAVESMCNLDGISRVETANTLEIGPTGASEDVEPDM